MADQQKQPTDQVQQENGRPGRAGLQSHPDSVMKKGGVARSDADIADVSRDTHGLPSEEGATGEAGGPTPPPGTRSPAAVEADEALTEALEEAKADEPVRKTDEGEALGE